MVNHTVNCCGSTRRCQPQTARPATWSRSRVWMSVDRRPRVRLIQSGSADDTSMAITAGHYLINRASIAARDSARDADLVAKSVANSTMTAIRLTVIIGADPVDRATGRLVHLPDTPFLVGDLDAKAVLAELVKGPVLVDNDVNWAALAERSGHPSTSAPRSPAAAERHAEIHSPDNSAHDRTRAAKGTVTDPLPPSFSAGVTIELTHRRGPSREETRTRLERALVRGSGCRFSE